MAGTCRIVVPAVDGLPAVVRLDLSDARPAADLYFLAEVPCDVTDARQFELLGYRLADAGTERAARRYSVLVRRPAADALIPPSGACDCKGSQRYDRGPCRHVRCLASLWRTGQL